MQRLRSLWGTYGSLTCWVVFGLAAIIAAQLSMNALLDTNRAFLETERAATEPVPRKAAALPDTSTWQTYRNEEYGFEVRYPSDWLIDTSRGKSTVVVYASDDASSRVVIAVGPTLAHGMEFFEKTSTEKFRAGSAEWSVSYWTGVRTNEGIGRDVNDRAITAGYYEGKTEYAVEAYYAVGKDSLFSVVLRGILSTFKFIESINTSTWKTYRNTKYGLEFQYPADHTAWVGVDQNNHVLVPALPTSDSVAITETESQLFCCEPNNLFISAVPGTESPRDWLDQHIGEFTTPAELKSVTDTIFAGKRAAEMRGAGSIGSAYRVLVILNSSHLVVMSQGAPSTLFDRILATFRFTQ